MRRLLMLAIALSGILVAACSAGGAGTVAAAPGDAAAARPVAAARRTSETPATPGCPSEGDVLDTAKLYIEHNATDRDTGVHGLFGGEAWSELCIWDPGGRLIFMAHPQGQLADLHVADLFFESREPPNDEYPLHQLRTDFPYPVDPPDGQDPIALNIDFTLEVPADVREVVVPAAFLQAGAGYEFELTAVDASGNRTFSVGTFSTDG